MEECYLLCEYCGNRWKPPKYWHTDKCPKCGDTNIRELEATGTDVFGYNVKPPRKTKK